jgi:hypothetical protein
VRERLAAHEAFVCERAAAGKEPKHRRETYGFPVITRQERRLVLPVPGQVRETAPGELEVSCSLSAEKQPQAPVERREAQGYQQAQLSFLDGAG